MKNVLSNTQEKIEGNVKVNIPKKVMDKINYLCTVISEVEWSGILFYSVKGSIKNPKKMSITLKDILPMDKGTAVTTEFTYDERYVEYLMNDPKRTDWKSGLIHSHNNMGVFYSGTDQQELLTNSKSHNFYLSVVVNNKLDIIGRIGISATIETEVEAEYQGLDEKGNSYSLGTSKIKVKEEKLFYIDCDMIYNRPTLAMEEEFLDNISAILKPKTTFKSTTSFPKKTTAKPLTMPKQADYIDNTYRGDNYWDDFSFDYSKRNFPSNRTPKVGFSKTSSNTPLKRECEDFLLKCFGYDEIEDEVEVTLKDIYEVFDEYIESEEMTMPELMEDFVSSFSMHYDSHFHNTIYGTELIITTIEEILSDSSGEFKFLGELVNILRKI